MGSGPSDYGAEVSAAQILKQLSEYTSVIVRQEIRRAQLEGNIPPLRPAAIGGPFGARGLLALLGAGALIAGAVIGLAVLLAPWMTATLLGVVSLLIAVGGTLRRKRRVAPAGLTRGEGLHKRRLRRGRRHDL
jgi:membrane protein